MRRKFKNAIVLCLGLIFLTFNSIAQGLEAIKKAINAEQYSSATASAKRLLTAGNSNGDAHFYLGETYLKVNQVDSAKSVFTKGTQVYPKNPLNFVGLGTQELMNANWNGAKNYFNLAVKVANKKDFRPYLYISAAYLSMSKPDFKAALSSLEKADKIDRKDTSSAIFIAFGNYYAQQRNTTEALKLYSKALTINPEDLTAKVRMGEVYAASGELAKADSILSAIVKQHPNYGPAYRALSTLHDNWLNNVNMDQTHSVLAAAYFEQYLAVTGRYYDFQIKFAELLYRTKDFKKLATVISELQAIPISGGKNATVERLSAYSAYENKNYQKALSYFDEYFAAIKDHSLIISDDYLYFGRTQLKLGQEEKAIFNILKAVELDNTKAPFIAEIARNHYNKKNWPKAIEYYQRMTTMAKGFILPAEDNLFHGTALFFNYVQDKERGANPSKDMLVEADRLFKEAYSKSPNEANAYLWSARALYLLEDFNGRSWAMVMPYEMYVKEQERSALPQTAATKRSLIEAYHVMAEFASIKQDQNKAFNYWNKILNLDPKDSAALAGIKLLSARGKTMINK